MAKQNEVVWLEVVGKVKSRAFGIDFGTKTYKTLVPILKDGSVIFDKNGVKVTVKPVTPEDTGFPLGLDTD